MSDSSMHSTEHPQSPAQDRCAWVESQLFEDIEIGNSSNAESALSKDKTNDHTPQDEVKRSSLKWKAIYYGSLILILLCLVVVPVAFHSCNQGGNMSGNISVASNAQYPGKTTSSCISNITLQQDLLSNIDECGGGGCYSRVALDGDTAVVRHGQNMIRTYTFNGEEWKKLPTVYRGTYSDTSIAISGKFAVLADFTTNEENRNVFVFEKGPADTKHKQSFDWHELDEEGSGFGQSLAINGHLMVIGAPGLAYVYQLKDDVWHLATKLDSPSISQSNVVAVSDDGAAITGINEEGQAVVLPYYKRKNQSGWEKMKEIVVDCDDDGCDDADISLAFTDDGDLMIGYSRNDTLYYYVLGGGEGAQYELKQAIRLPTGYLPDQVVVSGRIAIAKSSAKASLLFLVQNDGVWKIKTKKAYSTELSDMALSDRNLMVAVGHEVLWYTLDDCASIEISRSTTEDTPIPSLVPPPRAAPDR